MIDTNGLIKPPGDTFACYVSASAAIVIPAPSSTPTPVINWASVAVRYRTDKETNLTPSMWNYTTTSGRSINVPYTRSTGTMSRTGLSYPVIANGDQLRYVIGSSTYSAGSTEDSAIQVKGNIPSVSLYQENAGTDLKTWAFTMSSGSLVLSARTDAGTATAAFNILRTAGVATGISFSDSFNFTFTTTNGTKIGTGVTEKIGFWGATPVVKPTITGAKGSNAALSSLMVALSTMGLVVDSTTA
jgi:hypothetical protein